MKCPRCGYHNLPGAAACGQCGGGGAATSARVEEVYPPRARDRTWRQHVSEGLGGRIRVGVGAGGGAATAARAWLIASASLLPGWGQWLQGRRGAAGRLFGVALLSALALLVTIRHPLSGTFAALALFLVWYSVWDAARHAFPPSPAGEGARLLRLVRLALLSAAMVLSTLAAGYALLARRYELMVINTLQYAPIFQPADELMVRRLDHPLARLRRGDVVIGSPNGADPRSWVVHYGGEGGAMAPPAGAGPVIDRVIGLPGDRIDGAGTALWVNGAPLPPERCPLAFTAAPRFTAVVPRGCVAVREPGAGPAAEPLLMLPESGINGQVVAVTEPVERRRWMR